MTHHRASSLKQQNKKHKTGVTTKRSVKSRVAGRVERTGGPKSSADDAVRDARVNRLNHAKQLRDQKRGALWLQKRIGTNAGPPKVVLWVGLSPLADVRAAQAVIREQCSSHVQHGTDVDMTTVVIAQQKQRFTFISPERSVLAVLEFAKVADIVVLVLPVQGGEQGCVDEEGEVILTALKAQGLSAVVGVTQGLKLLSGKAQADMRRWGQRFFDSEFPELAKTADADNAVQMVRALVTAPLRPIHWRAVRSYLLAESTEVTQDLDGGGSSDCSGGGNSGGSAVLRVRGYLRGRPLGVNQLVHLSEAGQFRLRQIARAPEPCPIRRRHAGEAKPDAIGVPSGASAAAAAAMDVEMDGAETTAAAVGAAVAAEGVLEVLAVADPFQQEDVTLEAPVDELTNEQTWPTQEELALATEEKRTAAASARKPKGCSTYQAVWLDNGGAAVAGRAAGGSDEAMRVDGEGGEEWDDDGVDGDDDGDDFGGSILDEMDTEVAEEQRFREAEDARFPDEVEVPAGQKARQRLARYRALKSFRGSLWDPKESLPRDYARVYQFDDYLAVQKRIVAAGVDVERAQNMQLLEAAAVGGGGGNSRAASVAAGEADNEVVETAGEVADEPAAGSSAAGGGAANGAAAAQRRAGKKRSLSVASSAMTAALAAVVDGHEGFVASGQYVEITVAGVAADLLAARRAALGGRGWPLTLFSLQRFEGKLSVLHFNVQRDARDEEPVPSKAQLVFHCGFRRWSAKPVFSQTNLNCDKHKFERFLPQGRFCTASAYGPATFQPAPVLVFREEPVDAMAVASAAAAESAGGSAMTAAAGAAADAEAGAYSGAAAAAAESAPPLPPPGGVKRTLVATGTLLGVDPDRIILKKAVLTGYPIRVRKRRAVVKHMFASAEDVKWFKPAELTTKYGLAGHIKEPVGTHGLMKVVFSKAVKQNDTVCLNLYKRVYPKLHGDRIDVR